MTSYRSAATPSFAGRTSQVPQDPVKRNKWKEAFFGIPGILAGAVLGIIIGWAIQTGNPSADLVSWIAKPGDLFIRAVKCLVTPLVFCSVIVGMGDMLAIGKASSIGLRTAILYTLTTIIASAISLVWVIIFRGTFSNKAKTTSAKTADMAFQCDQPGYFLTNVNGSISCAFDEAFNSTGKFSSAATFTATDINSQFSMVSSGIAKRTLTAALQGQLDSIVPANITLAFSNADLLSVICFAIPFGVAIAMLPRGAKTVGNFVREMNTVLMTMVEWVILCTPIAVISLLAGAVGKQEDLSQTASDVAMLVLCDLTALSLHCIVFYPLLLRTFAHINPYKYLKHIIPAQTFAFGCASSMATLPMTMKCVDATKEVSQTLSRFVLSLGATINMDGTAIGYPIAIVFMAEAEGLGHMLGTVEMFVLVLVSTIGAIGAGPIPSGGLVMILTIWDSVFPGVPLPSTFALIVAVDWFLDRCRTLVNVTGDTVIARIVAYQTGEDKLDDEEREQLDSAMEGLMAGNAELKHALGSEGTKIHA